MTQSSRLFGTNFCTTMGLLTCAGAETVHDTTVSIQYCIEGKGYTKTAITDGATPTADGDGNPFPELSVTNADGSTSGKGTVVVWCLNAAGAVVCYQGSIEELDGSSTDFKEVDPLFPGIPDAETPFAYQILKLTTAGTTATFGSTNWNATGFTNSITDVMTLPRRRQSS